MTIIGSVFSTSFRNATSLLCVLIVPIFRNLSIWRLTIKLDGQAGKAILFIRGNGIDWRISAAYGIAAQAGDTPLFPVCLMRATSSQKLRRKGALKASCEACLASG